jgi:type I restriction enzyme S subunit
MSKLNKNRRGYKKTKVGWIPQEWECDSFGEIAHNSQYGLSQSVSEDGNIPIIGMSNLQDGKIVLESIKRVKISNVDFKKYCVKKNDLLFNRTNSLDLVGKTALAIEDMICVFASYLVRFSLNDVSVLPLYVACYFTFHDAVARLKALSTPGVSQYNINPTILQKHFYLPLPLFPNRKKSLKSSPPGTGPLSRWAS